MRQSGIRRTVTAPNTSWRRCAAAITQPAPLETGSDQGPSTKPNCSRFASGLIYGLLTIGDLQMAVEYGVAHVTLATTTPGDTSIASLAEVQVLMIGAGARVQRLWPRWAYAPALSRRTRVES